MTPITLAVFLLGLALIVVAAIFVAAPLVRTDLSGGTGTVDGERERWERQKSQALAAIKEAELDHQMGKLSDEDLTAMRTRFEAQALEAMAALQTRGGR